MSTSRAVHDLPVRQACDRLWAEYNAFAGDRENEPEAFLDDLRARLEELESAGAGEGVDARSIRVFLDEVTRDESADGPEAVAPPAASGPGPGR